MFISKDEKSKLQAETSTIKAFTGNVNAIIEMHEALKDVNFYNSVNGALNQFHINHAKPMIIPRVRCDYDAKTNDLPNELRRYITAFSDSTGYDHLSSLMGILGMTSIACNGKFIADINSRWHEQIALYILFLADSGSRKSMFIDMLKSPLKELLDHEYNTFSSKKQMFSSQISFEKEMLQKTLKSRVKQLSSNITFETDEEVQLYISEMRKTSSIFRNEIDSRIEFLNSKPSTLFANNLTGIGLAKLLADNNEYIAVCEPEGDLIDKLTTKNIDENLMNIALRAITGEGYSYISTKNNITLQHPVMNIMVATQPQNAIKFLLHKILITKGLVPKCIAISINPYRYQLNDPSLKEYTDIYRLKYSEFIVKLYKSSRELQSIVKIPFEKEAEEKANSIQLPENAHDNIKAYISKFRGTVSRIASLISIYHNFSENNCFSDLIVTSKHMDMAINIGKYLFHHADSILNTDNPYGYKSQETAKEIIECVKHNSWHYFTKRMFGQGRHLTNQNLLPALDLLEQYHWIIKIPGPNRAPAYVVNPLVFPEQDRPTLYTTPYPSFAVNYPLNPPFAGNNGTIPITGNYGPTPYETLFSQYNPNMVGPMPTIDYFK
jgi:hypothetical protein